MSVSAQVDERPQEDSGSSVVEVVGEELVGGDQVAVRATTKDRRDPPPTFEAGDVQRVSGRWGVLRLGPEDRQPTRRVVSEALEEGLEGLDTPLQHDLLGRENFLFVVVEQATRAKEKVALRLGEVTKLPGMAGAVDPLGEGGKTAGQ